MTLDFAKVASIGDVLSSDKHLLYFPDIPGVGDGMPFTLRHGAVTLPPMSVSPVIVKIFGWPRSFAGRREFENSFSLDFVETNGAPIIKKLSQWQDKCAGIKTAGGLFQSEYSVDCKFKVKDTTGETAILFKLINVWPKTINMPEFGEESAAMHVHCDFSIDAIDIEGVEVTQQSYSGASSSPVGPTVYEFDERTNGLVRTTDTNVGTFGHRSPVYSYKPRGGLGFSVNFEAQLKSIVSAFPSLSASVSSSFRF